MIQDGIFAQKRKGKPIKVTLGDKIQTLKIRKSGTKKDNKGNGSDAFPSEEETITIPAK
jgi:hypothetical protein